VFLAKEPPLRIDIDPPTHNCPEGQRLNLSLAERDGAMLRTIGSATTTCPKRLSAIHLRPGSYRLSAWIPGAPAAERLSASAEVEIHRDDVGVALDLRRPIRIGGTIGFAADGVKATAGEKTDFSGLRVSLSRVDGLPFADERDAAAPSQDGAFIVFAPVTRQVAVKVAGLKPPLYVKEILYNGSARSGERFEPNGQAIDHSLAIVLADDAATLDGSALDAAGKPLADATVAAVRWPLQMEDDFPVSLVATTDSSGRFSFTGVKPGTYRVLAVSPSDETIDRPGMLAALARDAREIQLEPRQSKSIVLEARR